MRKKVLYQEKGKCPFCGQNLSYTRGESEIIEEPSGDLVKYYGMRCDNCDFYIDEKYVLSFDDYVIGGRGEEISLKEFYGKEVEIPEF